MTRAVATNTPGWPARFVIWPPSYRTRMRRRRRDVAGVLPRHPRDMHRGRHRPCDAGAAGANWDHSRTDYRRPDFPSSRRGTGGAMKPIDQFIADPATPECVRRFLQWARFQAANDEQPPPLFANLDNCRVRV